MGKHALSLTRPLVAFDLETTGLDVTKDRIIEISCVKVGVDGSRLVHTRRLDPSVPISAEATAVHGLRYEDVAHEPTFAAVAESLYQLLDGCDLTGFNVEKFDVPMLRQEFRRVGLDFPDPDVAIIDSRSLFVRKEPRNLSTAYRLYCNQTLENAHSAEADAVAALEILLAQIARYDDVPADIFALRDFLKPTHPDWVDSGGQILWRDSTAVLGFGKHRHRSLEELVNENPDYLQALVAHGGFGPDVAYIVRDALAGRFPRPPCPDREDRSEELSRPPRAASASGDHRAA